MSQEDLNQIPFQAYDLEGVYDSELAPLINKLHEECQRLGLPLFVAVGIKMGANGDNRIAATAFFNGPERTPAELVACHLAAAGDWEQVPGLMFQDIQRCRHAQEAIDATKH